MPTIKHKRAFKEVVNGSSISKAMRTVGYSEETSKRTNKLTKTKGWGELMEKYLPDKLLAKVHKEGLSATKRSGTGGMVLNTEKSEFGHTEIDEPDYAVRHKYLDSAYKLKGSYAPEKQEVITANIDIDVSKILEKGYDKRGTSTKMRNNS